MGKETNSTLRPQGLRKPGALRHKVGDKAWVMEADGQSGKGSLSNSVISTDLNASLRGQRIPEAEGVQEQQGGGG